MLSAQRSARRIDWFQGKFTIVPCILPHSSYRRLQFGQTIEQLNRWILLSQFSLIHPPEKRPDEAAETMAAVWERSWLAVLARRRWESAHVSILTWAVQPRRERLITRWGAMKLLIPRLCTLDSLEIVSYYAMLSTMMDSTMPRITKLLSSFFFFNLEKSRFGSF